jgi:hypothetical protein
LGLRFGGSIRLRHLEKRGQPIGTRKERGIQERRKKEKTKLDSDRPQY